RRYAVCKSVKLAAELLFGAHAVSESFTVLTLDKIKLLLYREQSEPAAGQRAAPREAPNRESSDSKDRNAPQAPASVHAPTIRSEKICRLQECEACRRIAVRSTCRQRVIYRFNP
ncbi:MAG: hypothetical protein IJM20_03535, partial [Clostridia bacterium]|nr:hypothetical protein [Clostridia bacterium]